VFSDDGAGTGKVNESADDFARRSPQLATQQASRNMQASRGSGQCDSEGIDMRADIDDSIMVPYLEFFQRVFAIQHNPADHVFVLLARSCDKTRAIPHLHDERSAPPGRLGLVHKE